MSAIMSYGNYIFKIAPLMSINTSAKRSTSLEKHYDIVTLNLSSTLLPSGDFSDWTINDMYSQVSTLRTAFSVDNLIFSISGNGKELIRLTPSGSSPKAVKAVSLNIPTAKFVDQTPFELTLEYYDNNDSSIIDKTLQYGFATNEDGLYEVWYSIEAIGLNTSSGISNALDNARSCVS